MAAAVAARAVSRGDGWSWSWSWAADFLAGLSRSGLAGWCSVVHVMRCGAFSAFGALLTGKGATPTWRLLWEYRLCCHVIGVSFSHGHLSLSLRGGGFGFVILALLFFFFVWVCGIYGAYNTTEQLGSHLLYNYVYYYLARSKKHSC